MTAPQGPLDAAPEVTARQAAAMLDEALAGLELGAWNLDVRGRVGFAEPAYVAAIASWIARAAEAIG